MIIDVFSCRVFILTPSNAYSYVPYQCNWFFLYFIFFVLELRYQSNRVLYCDEGGYCVCGFHCGSMSILHGHSTNS
jgi:hypothetical protein